MKVSFGNRLKPGFDSKAFDFSARWWPRLRLRCFPRFRFRAVCGTKRATTVIEGSSLTQRRMIRKMGQVHMTEAELARDFHAVLEQRVRNRAMWNLQQWD